MFLVTATLPTGPVPGEEALDQLVRRLAVPEDLLEHVHVAPLPGGGSRLTLFLGHAQSAGAEESAVRLVARALPPRGRRGRDLDAGHRAQGGAGTARTPFP